MYSISELLSEGNEFRMLEPHTHTHTIPLGAIHNCQHLIECAKHTLSQNPFPPQKVYISTFFKWKICHEIDKTKWVKMSKVYGINIFFHFFSRSHCTVKMTENWRWSKNVLCCGMLFSSMGDFYMIYQSGSWCKRNTTHLTNQ